MKRLSVVLLAAFCTLAASCFNPKLGDEPFACGPDDACPSGYVCVGATGLCTKKHDVDAGPADASTAFGKLMRSTWSIELNGAPISSARSFSARTFELSPPSSTARPPPRSSSTCASP